MQIVYVIGYWLRCVAERPSCSPNTLQEHSEETAEKVSIFLPPPLCRNPIPGPDCLRPSVYDQQLACAQLSTGGGQSAWLGNTGLVIE